MLQCDKKRVQLNILYFTIKRMMFPQSTNHGIGWNRERFKCRLLNNHFWSLQPNNMYFSNFQSIISMSFYKRAIRWIRSAICTDAIWGESEVYMFKSPTVECMWRCLGKIILNPRLSSEGVYHVFRVSDRFHLRGWFLKFPSNS